MIQSLMIMTNGSTAPPTHRLAVEVAETIAVHLDEHDAVFGLLHHLIEAERAELLSAFDMHAFIDVLGVELTRITRGDPRAEQLLVRVIAAAGA